MVPGPCPSGLASTRWKMFSAMSCSALVMNRFTPSMCQVPSGCSIALVRPAPTSEPASGSVSTIVAPHSRSTASSANRRCSGVPMCHRTFANEGPPAYIQTAALAPRISSASDQVLPLLSTAVNSGAGLPRSGLAAKDSAGIKAAAAPPSINERRTTTMVGMFAGSFTGVRHPVVQMAIRYYRLTPP